MFVTASQLNKRPERNPVSDKDLTNLLLASSPRCSAGNAENRVPDNKPGYYAIFIDFEDVLPKTYAKYLHQREDRNLLYIGIATKSLFKRLVQQDLQHNSPSSFFRSLGAVLGYRPKPGSLAGMKNKSNYKFSDADTTKIRDWINSHLSITWICVDAAFLNEEKKMIGAKSPLLNIAHNPKPLHELRVLRARCKQIARMRVERSLV